MGNLGDALEKHAERLGIARQVEAADVVERATKEIAKFIPREDFEVVSFNRGTLKIKVKSSVVASEIRMREAELRKAINRLTRLKLSV
ncbi:MAG: DciA family protein [Patescibacteria group bacterium]|nr:DciA family protein [Patescibacteria group bacterium]